jgi:hypothetical protein
MWYKPTMPHRSTRRLIAVLFLGPITVPGQAQTAIAVGDIVIDPPTISSLGFSVPILGGDDNYNATTDVSYRQGGTANWSPALPFMRIRPETIGSEDPPENFGLPRPGEQFAGSILNLLPGTQYDVRIAVMDPDGGSRTQTAIVTTHRVPRSIGAAPRTIGVSTAEQLRSALRDAAAGDVIVLASGTYAGRFDVIGRNGTADNPIVIRGQDKNNSIVDASGNGFGILVDSSNHVHVENLKIIGARGSGNFGLYLNNGAGLTARNLIIESDNGIDAMSGQNRDFYICDNELLGPTVWPDDLAVGTGTSAKGWIGIGIGGQGHTVCHNELAGFGSTLFVQMSGRPEHNISIDIHNNEIQWSADDGIELDGSFRNVRAWGNRVRNVLMGISFQPVWGGPVYAVNNIVYNSAAAPFKLNNDPTGVVLYHNTAFRYEETDILGPYDGYGWPQLGESFSYAANVWIKNNIVIGNGDALFLRQDMLYMDLDYNGYWPDGRFGLQSSGSIDFFDDLSSFRAGTGFEASGVVLSDPVFEAVPSTEASYRSLAPPLDFALHAQSTALDKGVALPTINDGYTGGAPDLGAAERGAARRIYGPRDIDLVAPAAPSGLTVQ